MIPLNNSFGLNSSVSNLILVDSQYKKTCDKPWFILGDASNCVIDHNLSADCIKANFYGIETIRDDKYQILCRVGASINWHEFVLHCVANGWHGIENLALIPGTVGAAPIQNIGAYGCEISEKIYQVETIDLTNGEKHILKNPECLFSYRDSIFKKQLKQHLVTHIQILLEKNFKAKIKHKNLQPTNSAQTMLQQIIKIRSSKLPDPKKTGNAGSFFKNPLICTEKAKTLLDIQNYPSSEGLSKVSAAALIEKAGLKGFRIGGAAVSNKHALVIVNYKQATYSDIKNLANYIKNKVYEKFEIKLENEVQFIDQEFLQLQLEQTG